MPTFSPKHRIQPMRQWYLPLLGLLLLVAFTTNCSCNGGIPCPDGVIKNADDESCVHKCETGQAACGTECINPKTDDNNCGLCGNKCGDNAKCVDGKCEIQCKTSETKCGNVCVDAQSDTNNCGGCGQACKPGEVCENAACTIKCDNGATKCGDACVDTKKDTDHCGACGTKCEVGEKCLDGKCGIECKKDLTACSGSCVDTQKSTEHCGACGTKCDTGEICDTGKCKLVCDSGEEICDKKCVDTKSDTNHCGTCGTQCAQDEVCSAGKCSLFCPKSTPSVCDRGCFNIKTSKDHCGKCSNKCSADKSCVNGQCVCPPGAVDCGGACIDPKSDPANCGKCGTKCNKGEVCANGLCEVSCPANSPDVCDGGCVDTKTNNAHCGACKTVCAGSTKCVAGKCECPQNLTSCNQKCTDTNTDRLNCGKCGTKCGPGTICDNGTCKLTCATPLVDCNNACVNTNNDTQHCGQCGNACKTGQYCEAGKCADKCAFTVCNGTCTDTQNDRINCGTCGTKCSAQQVCTAGQCKLLCQQGFTDCNGTCYDLTKETQHCGKCGTACQGKETCVNSVCTLTCPSGLNACQGNCTNYNTNRNHCGGCGKACANQEACIAGKCTFCPDCPLTALRAGGRNYDEGRASAIDSKGNIYVAGIFNGSANFDLITLTSAGSTDIFVAKLDPSGNVIWAKSFGDTNANQVYGIALDKTDNIYITGHFSGSIKFGTTTLTSTGSNDIYVTKLDNGGNLVWANKYGGTSSEQAFGIAVASDNNIYVSGTMSGSYKVGTTTYTTTNTDGAIIKLDDKGVVQWYYFLKDTGSSQFRGIAIDGSDNIYTTGYWSGQITNGTTTLQSKSLDSVVVKLDKTAKVAWMATSSGTGAEYAQAIAVDASGNAHITGYFNNQATFGTTNLDTRGNNDIFVAKVNATGTFAWANSGGSINADLGTGIGVDSSGNTYVTGTFSATFYIAKGMLFSRGNNDIFLAKFDSNGKMTGLLNAGGTSTDRANHLALDAQNNAYVTGYFYSSSDFGKVTLASAGSGDIFLAKYGAIGCPANQPTCAGECVHLAINKDHCGTCQNACSGANICESRVCRSCLACPTGLIETGGRRANEYPTHMTTDSAGNIYVVGYYSNTAQFGTKTWTAKDSNDFFVVKLNAAGAVVWSYANGGLNSDVARRVDVDSAGNVYVAGDFFHEIDFGNNIKIKSQGYQDMFVLKLNSSGTPQWAQSGGSLTHSETVTGLAVDSKGAAYITGEFSRSAIFGTNTLTSPGSNNNRQVYLVKLNSTGAYVYARHYGTTTTDYARGLAVDGGDNVYLMGMFYSTLNIGTISLRSKGSGDVYIVKLNEQGVVQWANSFGSTTYENPLTMITDNAGNIYASVSFYTTLDIGSTTLTATANATSNRYDIAIFKLNTSGVPQWAVSAGGIDHDYAQALALNSAGELYVSGTFYDTMTINKQELISNGFTNGFIAKIDSTGKWTTAISGGTPNNNFIYGLALDSAGDLLWGIRFYRSGQFGTQTLTLKGNGYDVAVVKLKALP